MKYSLFFLRLYMQLAFLPTAPAKARRQTIYQKTIKLEFQVRLKRSQLSCSLINKRTHEIGCGA